MNIRSLARAVTTLLTLATVPTLMAQQAGQDEVVAARARDLHARAIVVDTHDDTTRRMVGEPSFDLGAKGATGSIDLPRIREGGLDALFFSIFVPGDVTGPQAVKRALQQIDRVREAVTWADSSGDTPVHNGLTPFGKDVVRELNRLGVMVDCPICTT